MRWFSSFLPSVSQIGQETTSIKRRRLIAAECRGVTAISSSCEPKLCDYRFIISWGALPSHLLHPVGEHIVSARGKPANCCIHLRISTHFFSQRLKNLKLESLTWSLWMEKRPTEWIFKWVLNIDRARIRSRHLGQQWVCWQNWSWILWL